MEKTDTNPQAKRHVPYFNKGVLAFQESGHTLTHAKYYVCSKKLKQQCKLPEQRIKVESLERNFSRLAKSFEIPDEHKWPALKHLIGEILHDQINELLESEDFHHDIFDNAIALMHEDIENKDDKNFKADLKDGIKAMEKESERKTEFICGLLTGCILAFGKKNVSESDAGRTLAYLSQKVYLSNDGKIVKIKLHDFGEYVFQYMKQHIPGYTEPFKHFARGRKFETLRYKEVAKGIKAGKLEMAVPSLAIGATVAKTFDILRKLTKMKKEDAAAILWFLNESPLGQTMQDLKKFIKNRKRLKSKESVPSHKHQ